MCVCVCLGGSLHSNLPSYDRHVLPAGSPNLFAWPLDTALASLQPITSHAEARSLACRVASPSPPVASVADVGFYVFDANFEQIRGFWDNPYFRGGEGDSPYFVFHSFALWPAGTDDGRPETQTRQYMVSRPLFFLFFCLISMPHFLTSRTFWMPEPAGTLSALPLISSTRRPIAPPLLRAVVRHTRIRPATGTGSSHRRQPTSV